MKHIVARPAPWSGSHAFVLRQLILKDFRVRYRNMSLGVLWSLINPLVLMAVYSFVFTKILKTNTPHFGIYLLSGIVTYNFFCQSWSVATSSLMDNASLIKRVPIRREIVPMAAILSHGIHIVIQLFLLMLFVIIDGVPFTAHWLWLPVVWILGLLFVFGLSLITSVTNVIIRDTRYVVDSVNVVLFWIVPIVYSFDQIPPAYKDLYQYNPVAALMLATRNIILEHKAPSLILLTKLAVVSLLAVVVGYQTFRRFNARLYGRL